MTDAPHETTANIGPSDLTDAERAKAEARAQEMTLILARWVEAESTLRSEGGGIRNRLRAMSALRAALRDANRVTGEILGDD